MAIGITFDPSIGAPKLTDNPEDLAFDMAVEGHLRSSNEKTMAAAKEAKADDKADDKANEAQTPKMYALIAAPEEPFELLNKKKLKLKIRKQANHLGIMPVDEDQIVWETSAIQSVDQNDNTVTITTRNSVYKFLRIDNLGVETLEHDLKGINYGNGHSKYVYKFSRALSQEELEAWLRVNYHLVRYEHAWYEDYCVIKKLDDGFTWEYTHVMAYTD